MNKKILAIVAAALLLCVAVGGTMAYLTATTEPVTNTFTPAHVGDPDGNDSDIELKEHEYIPASNTLHATNETDANANYVIVPGYTAPKDPFVRISPSVEARVFVTVTEKGNMIGEKQIMTYAVGAKWTKVVDRTKVGDDYVTVYTYNDMIPIVEENGTPVVTSSVIESVTYSPALTSAELQGMTSNPQLVFNGYSIQWYSSNNVPFSADDAWKQLGVQPQNATVTE